MKGIIEDKQEIFKDAEIMLDDFSGAVFGKDGQIKVLGWTHRDGRGVKTYLVKCAVCSLDPELNGSALYKAFKSDLILGSIPCGCSKAHKWTEDQYKTRVGRICNQKGLTFIGWNGNFCGGETRLALSCGEHGPWGTTKLSNFLQGNRGCPTCGKKVISAKISASNTKTDDVMVQSFIASGAFPDGVEFWRSDKVDKMGRKVYWNLKCPVCNSVSVSQQGHLQNGKYSCDCTTRAPKYAYIKTVKDAGMVVGIKYGITKDNAGRLRALNYSSVYLIEDHSIFEFKNQADCRRAENECRIKFSRLHIDRALMSDGWTEVTYPHYLEDIEEVYIKNGGVKINE